jgi:hypothetical protein
LPSAVSKSSSNSPENSRSAECPETVLLPSGGIIIESGNEGCGLNGGGGSPALFEAAGFAAATGTLAGLAAFAAVGGAFNVVAPEGPADSESEGAAECGGLAAGAAASGASFAVSSLPGAVSLRSFFEASSDSIEQTDTGYLSRAHQRAQARRS